MKTSWTKGIKDEQVKADVVSAFKSSGILRKRLKEMINAKEASKQKDCQNVSNYEKNSWAFQMADSQGYLRAMTEILSLIEN
jgi:hypothetical protein